MSSLRIQLETDSGRLPLAQGATTIGRSRTCGVRLEDLSASRNHALLSRDGDRVTVRDLESSNGTFLNGERLEREVELQHGDVITIGETELRLLVLEQPHDRGSDTVGAGLEVATDLSTQYVPRQSPSPPSSSEAVAVGDALPVGEVLAQSRPSWKNTSVLPAPEPPAAPRVPPPPPAPLPFPASPPRPAAASQTDSVELLPSIEDIERQLAAQEAAVAKAGGVKAPATRSAQPAGFFRRFFAVLIDSLLAAVVALGVSFVAGGPLDPTGGAVLALVNVVGLALLHILGWLFGGASPGKRLLGLVVRDDQGRVGLSIGRALLRYVGYFVSFIPLGAGFLIPLFHPQKKALHDLIAGTSVTRR